MSKLLSQRNLAVLIAILAALPILTGCVPRFLNSRLPDVVVVDTTPNTSQVTSPGADAHFVMVDDYFIMEGPLEEQAYVYAAIGKMLEAPKGGSGEARFNRLLDQQEIRTPYYAKTRRATENDYQLGREVFFLNSLDNEGNYRAPENASETQTGWWLKSKITDTSEVYRGLISITGGYKVNLNALRVVAN